MSGSGPRLEIEGLSEHEKKLAQLSTFLFDLRPFWPKVIPLWIGWMREQFESEGAWGGSPWAPLSERYARRKLRIFGPRSILYASGDLRKAASLPQRRASARQLTLRIESPVAGFHQEPGDTASLPRREIIPDRFPASALREIDEAGEEYIDDLVRRLDL